MKRTSKKLSLRSETLRSLTPGEMGDAAGGTVIILNRPPIFVKSRLVYCPVPPIPGPKPSLVDGCPSALGCTFTVVINPGGGF